MDGPSAMAKSNGLIGALTPKEHRTLFAIREYCELHGFAPTYDEISKTTSINNRGEVHRLVVALEGKGFIERDPRRARGINVTGRGMQVKKGVVQSPSP